VSYTTARHGPADTTPGYTASGSTTHRQGCSFEFDYDTVLAVTARRDRLDTAVAAMAADSEFTPVVHRLGCLRGISTLTALGLVVEIGDSGRYIGNTIGSFVGLMASEHSSGASRSQGPITKAARRLLVEAACTTGPNTGPARSSATVRARHPTSPGPRRRQSRTSDSCIRASAWTKSRVAGYSER
jgi:transposase